MKKIIVKLYKKFCERPIDSLYLAGIQRDFGKVLSDKEAIEIQKEVQHFIGTEAFGFLFNEKLKDYVKILICLGETEKERDYAIMAINILLNLEELFLEWGKINREEEENFNPYEIL